MLSVSAPPDLVLSIPVDGKGMVMSPPVEFSPDESVMFVSVVTTRAVAWKWWKEHQADIGVGVLLLVVLLAAWWMRRVWRRPRVAGRWYCRRCNYDVTRDTPGDDAAAATIAQCPECGSALGPGAAVAGTTFRRRVLPVTIAALLVGGVCLWRINASLTNATFGKPAWPLEAVRRVVPGWPWARKTFPDEQGYRVRCFDTTTWREIGAIERGLGGARSTPRGESLVWTEFGLGTGWNNELVIAPTNGASAQRVRLGTNADGFASIVGFTSDGREVLVIMNGLVGPPSGAGPFAQPDGMTTVRLLGVDFHTHKVREIGFTRVAALRGAPNQWSIPIVAGAAEGGAHGGWAMFVMTGPDAPKVVWGVPRGAGTEQALPPRQYPSSAHGADFRWRDGDLAIRVDGSNPVELLLRRDGSVGEKRRGLPMWVTQFNADGNVSLRGNDGLAPRIISLESMRPGATVVQQTRSPEDRFHAVFSIVSSGGRTTGAEVRVFDLARLRNRPEPPRASGREPG